MTSKLENLPPDLRRGILQYYHRKRTLQCVSALLSCAVLYVFVVWVAMHVDRFTFLTIEQREHLVVTVHGIVALIAAVRVLLLFLRRCPAREVAYAIEAKLGPAIEERYSTLVDVLKRDESELGEVERQFIDELVSETLKRDTHRRLARLVSYRRHWWWLIACGLAVLCFFLPALSKSYEFGLMLERFYLPRKAHPRPSFVKIESIPGARVIGEGQEFVLQVKTQGRVPRLWMKVLKSLGRELTVGPELHLMSGAESGAAPQQERELTRIGEGRYIFAQTDVREGFRYRVRCGDAQTKWSEVEVVSVPEITEIKLHVTPPPYSRLEPRTIVFEGQSFLFLKGTAIRLVFQTNQAVEERVILSDILEKPVIPVWDEETNRGAYRFVLRDKMTLRIKVKNRRGFENASPALVSFRLLEDHPPTVLLKAEEVLRHTSATDRLALPFLVEDDYGISEVAASYIVNPAPGQQEGAEEQKFAFHDCGRKLSDVGHFDLRAAKVYPGDRVLLRVRARDSAGQSGLSQGVLIEVTSFGRGAREEIRIRNLRFLTGALGRAVESTSTGDRPETARLFISGGIYRRIIEEARATGVWLSEENSLRSLFDVLEREHVLTSSPWDKEDLRRVHSALALCATSAISREDPIGYRNEMVVRMIEEALIPLLDYRELKNLMWRFFGLRDAVTTLAESASAIDSRRLELVFITLERSAARLLRVSSRVKSVDSSRLREEIKGIGQTRRAVLGGKERADVPAGEFEEGFDGEFIDPVEGAPEKGPEKRDGISPASARASLKRLSGQLSSLLSISQGGILEAAQTRKEANKALAGMYEGQFAELVSPPPRDDGLRDWWRRTMAILDKDTRLIRANPHHRLWPPVRNYVLSRSLLDLAGKFAEQGKKGEDKAPPLPEPTFIREAPPSFQAHERAQDELLVAAELMELGHLQHVSAIEKEFAARWMVLALEERHGGATDEQRNALRNTDLARPPSGALRYLARPESMCRSKLEYLALEQQVRAAVLKHVASIPIVDQAQHLLATFHATNRVLGDKVRAQEALVLEKQVLRCVVERLHLELMTLPEAADAGRPLEAFYLKLREFRDRPPMSLHQLEAAPGLGQLSPGDLDDVDLDLRALGRHRGAAYHMLSSFITKLQNGEEQSLDDYQQALAEEFEKTRSYVGVCAELSAAEDKTETARRYIGGSEEATMAYLASSLPRLHSAVTFLRNGQSALRQERTADGAYRTAMEQAQQALERYLKIISLSRPSTFRERLAGELRNVGASIEKLRSGQTKADTTLYEAENLIRKLEDLSREVAAHSLRVGKLRFTGAARDIGEGLSRARLFEAGRRLADEVELHRERVNVGIFELLDDNPQLEVHQMAPLHAAFLYRIVRSDLARFKAVEPILGQGHRPNYIGFLRSALSEAGKIKIIYYRDTIPPFLTRMGQHRWELPKK